VSTKIQGDAVHLIVDIQSDKSVAIGAPAGEILSLSRGFNRAKRISRLVRGLPDVLWVSASISIDDLAFFSQDSSDAGSKHRGGR
jgi:hypothetical protein